MRGRARRGEARRRRGSAAPQIRVGVLMAGLGLAQVAAAQLRMTLKQAVEMALSPDGNTRVQLAGEGIRTARARSAQARAALLPSLDSYVAEQNQTRNLAAFGIQIQIPIPGFVFPTVVGPFNTFDARVTATQSVFDFSSIRRFQASRVAVKASQADNDAARDQATAQVAAAYMSALAAQAHRQASQANVDLAEALARLGRNRKNAGTGLAIEVTRAEVELANARQRLLVADNEARRAKLELLRVVGVSLDTSVELADALADTPAEPVSMEQALKEALASRPDWKAQKTREENARLGYSATKYERLPSVASFADYGSIGTGVTSASPTRTYGVSLRLPVFDGGRRDARRSESFSQYRQEQIRSADLREQMELEVRLALDSLQSAADQLKVAGEGLEQAERETAQAQRRYEAGVASSLEPTDAQTRLARARDNRIAALLGYNLARINLAQAMGAIRQLVH
jgi:outer membrane protein